ncbi:MULTISPECIES: YpiF family protein [Bacillus]|uniref:YpiF family protein n=1 Tax=Bacillus TaxID=1386 RepID=UPI000BB87497|nr:MULTISPECIES: YpiF family protein [Bacillus]
MKWTSKDITVFEQSKEYIDTVVIPLIPINFSTNVKQTAALGEYINILSNELERQFKGRIILLPSYTYLSATDQQKNVAAINEYVTHLLESDIKHVFLLTSDNFWQQVASEITEAKLMWLPSIPLEDMEEKYKQKIITDQMNQLLPIFIQKWQ